MKIFHLEITYHGNPIFFNRDRALDAVSYAPDVIAEDETKALQVFKTNGEIDLIEKNIGRIITKETHESLESTIRIFDYTLKVIEETKKYSVWQLRLLLGEEDCRKYCKYLESIGELANRI